MRQTWLYKHPAQLALALVAALSFFILPSSKARDIDKSIAPQTDPATSLSRGRTLLKRGHADQALPLLESALSGFTSTNNARGVAAAQDALGDLYMIQGQYKVALDHYRSAYQSFVIAGGKD